MVIMRFWRLNSAIRSFCIRTFFIMKLIARPVRCRPYPAALARGAPASKDGARRLLGLLRRSMAVSLTAAVVLFVLQDAPVAFMPLAIEVAAEEFETIDFLSRL